MGVGRCEEKDVSTGVGYGPLVPPEEIRSRKGQLDLTEITVCEGSWLRFVQGVNSVFLRGLYSVKR